MRLLLLKKLTLKIAVQNMLSSTAARLHAWARRKITVHCQRFVDFLGK